MASFSSEGTIGLILISRLIPGLQHLGRQVLPMTYWKTREGSRSTVDAFEGKRLKPLALFARRPKLMADPDEIVCRINDVLGDFAEHARHLGIRTIAGFPLARDLDELQLGIHDLWFPIEPHLYSTDLVFDLNRKIEHSIRRNGIEAWSLERISLAFEETPPMTWKQVKGCFSELRDTLTDGNNSFHGSGYKPIYLLEVV